MRLDSSSSLTKRKPVPGSEAVPRIAEPIPPKPPLSRRPLGPRPQPSESHVERKPLSNSSNKLPGESTTTTVAHNSPTSPHEATSGKPLLQAAIPPSQSSEVLPAFTITVIRRDPSSSSQWNIGTITGTPSPLEEARQSSSPQRSKKPYFELNVHLTNPGYTPFNKSYLSSQFESLKLSPTSPLRASGGDANRSNNMRADYGFTRDVRMEGVDFWKRTIPQHKRSKSDMTVKQGITRGRSFSGSEAVEPTKSPQPETLNTSKGYAFYSPWNGRCKFLTSSSGRSLRCRHTLPEPVSAINKDEHDRRADSSVVVSEIRFNLPSQAIFNSV